MQAQKYSPQYSILLPTYEERENLPLIVYMIMEVAENQQGTISNLSLEIVVVDDNSPDGTQYVVKDLQRIYGESRIVLKVRPGKLGLGSAYIDGIDLCRGEFIFLMDADLSHHVRFMQPKYIPQFIKKQVQTKADIVTGTRYVRGGGVCGWDLKRKLTSRVANFIAAFLLNPQCSDLTGSFRLYKRDVLMEVVKSIKSTGYVFQMEAIVRARERGYRIEEVPIIFVDRIYGESKLGANEIASYLKGLWAIFWDARVQASIGQQMDTNWVFFNLLSVSYLSAFMSHYGQISGLWGADGILPVALVKESSVFVKIFGVLAQQLAPYIKEDPSETLLYLICLSGSVLSAFTLVFTSFQNTISYAILWILIQLIVAVGGVFMHFQWDILLIESGFLAILFARYPFQQSERTAGQEMAKEMIRWLTFRYILGSGIAKLQSGCQTWWELTALFYHFETQCLPNALSWYFHQLPAPILKFGAAFTYAVLILGPFMFYSGFRKLSVTFQIIFQILIILSGNYNFFNILSIGLQDLFRLFVAAEKPRFDIFGKLSTMFLIGFVLYAMKQMNIQFDLQSFERILKSEFFMAVFIVIQIYLIIQLLYMIYENGLKIRFFPQLLGLLTIGICAVYFYSSLFIFLRSINLNHNNLPFPQPKVLEKSWSYASQYKIANSYGLFRRMTGVGGRPELIIQGSQDGIEWEDYVLPYKPQALDRMPPFNIPHQPRLDWQMWFAALNTINFTPWMYNLLFRLSYHSESTLSLFESYPNSPPEYLRIEKYYYNFTTVDDHHWKTSKQLDYKSYAKQILQDLRRTYKNKNWWTREYEGEWLQVISPSYPRMQEIWEGLSLKKPKTPLPLHRLHSLPLNSIVASIIIGGLLLKLLGRLK